MSIPQTIITPEILILAVTLLFGIVTMVLCFIRFVIKGKSAKLKFIEKSKANGCVVTARCVKAKITSGAARYEDGRICGYDITGVRSTYEYKVFDKVYRKKYSFNKSGASMPDYPNEITLYYAGTNPRRAMREADAKTHRWVGFLITILITALVMFAVAQLLFLLKDLLQLF